MNTSDKKATDPIDKLIFEDKLRAKQVFIDKDVDVLIVLFNNGNVLKLTLSDFPKLKKASKKKLENWKLIGGGIGVRWEDLDEDLSIKGFIKSAVLKNTLHNLRGSDEKVFS